MRAVNLYVTSGAVGILGVLIVLWAGWLQCPYVMRHAMTCEAKLIDGAEP